MNLALCAPIFFSNGENILREESFSPNDKAHWSGQIALLKDVYRYRQTATSDNFEDVLQAFILMNEGFSLSPYYDSVGIPTIGAGLALTDKLNNFKPLAVEAFNFIGKNLYDFFPIDRFIKAKTEILTKEEGSDLLLFVLKKFRPEIKEILIDFDWLPLNIQIAVESLHYNASIFIQGGMGESLELFAKTKDQKYLEDVLWRICRNCNRGAPYEGREATTTYWKGLQYRRYREMLMCSNNEIDEKYFPIMYNCLVNNFCKKENNDSYD